MLQAVAEVHSKRIVDVEGYCWSPQQEDCWCWRLLLKFTSRELLMLNTVAEVHSKRIVVVDVDAVVEGCCWSPQQEDCCCGCWCWCWRLFLKFTARGLLMLKAVAEVHRKIIVDVEGCCWSSQQEDCSPWHQTWELCLRSGIFLNNIFSYFFLLNNKIKEILFYLKHTVWKWNIYILKNCDWGSSKNHRLWVGSRITDKYTFHW